ncbi:TPA: hypothetical protein ACTUT5_003450 [Legionella anisa]|uniref:hypothetical protein n=1 Tax=Legionella anisa TaxID=28082 RepID=UPI00197E0ABC|nr:hypothetical protein [Legionella anisa]MBN5937379.1 hypothetical protein [Legionella anisa]
MFIKPVIALFGFALYFSPFLAAADETKMCNDTQQGNCGRFCQAHQGMKSCIIDITTKSGTCTCEDGVSHTKS